MERIGGRRWLTGCMLIISAALLFFIGGCSSGVTEPAFNVSGNWDIYTTTSGTVGEAGPGRFSFSTYSSTLSGYSPETKYITGEVSDLNISFSWVASDGYTYSYTGLVSNNGTTMSGTWTNTNNQSGTWNGIIISTSSTTFTPTINIAGNWNVFLTTDGTTGEEGPEAVTFTQSSNTLGGTALGQQIVGSIASSNVTTVLFFWNDGTSNFAFTGIANVDGNSMQGTWTNTSGKTGTWRATKS